MDKPTTNLNRFKVEKTRKDEALKEQVERVRTILNASRIEAGYKTLPYLPYFLALKKRGYDSADKIYSLIAGCRDAQNPSKTLNFKVFSK